MNENGTLPIWGDIQNFAYLKIILGIPLVVQWLRLHTSNAGGKDLIPGRGTNIPHAPQHGRKKKIILTKDGFKLNINYKQACETATWIKNV